jgi:hypothetical protein
LTAAGDDGRKQIPSDDVIGDVMRIVVDSMGGGLIHRCMYLILVHQRSKNGTDNEKRRTIRHTTLPVIRVAGDRKTVAQRGEQKADQTKTLFLIGRRLQAS